jgi:hypothetical protein
MVLQNNQHFGEEVDDVKGFGLQPTNLLINVEGDVVETGAQLTEDIINEGSQNNGNSNG